MSVSEVDVRNAYRFFLGRAPESDRVVRQHQEHAKDFEDLRRTFIGSREFLLKSEGVFTSPERPFLAFEPPQDVDVELDETKLSKVVARLGSYWSSIGAEAPHWSVLTNDHFRPERLDENRSEFYASGYLDQKLVASLLARINRSPKEFQNVVEFGCGVGRCTIPLAKAFRQVTAIDISPNHLELAKQYARKEILSNVSFILATHKEVMPARDYDLWFSRLVLQHDPPPVTLAILEAAFRHLKNDGVAIVHLPTYMRDYRFKANEYIADENPPNMEMHVIPARFVFEAAFRNECCLVDVHEEPGHTVFVTHIMTFQKFSRRCPTSA